MRFEEFYITGRGIVLVPRSAEEIENKREIGDFIKWDERAFEVIGLEISRALMSPPVEKSRAYNVREYVNKYKYDTLMKAYAAQNTMVKEIFTLVVEMNSYHYDTLHQEHRAWQIQQKVDSSLNEYSHTIYKLERK